MIAQIAGPGEILKRMKGNVELEIIGIFYSLRFDKLKSMNWSSITKQIIKHKWISIYS